MKAIRTVIINYINSEEPILEFFNKDGGKREVSLTDSSILLDELETIYETIKEPEDLLLEKEIELNEKEALLAEKANDLEEKRIEAENHLENTRAALEELLKEDQLELFLFLYDEWEAGVEYFVNDKVSYNNKLYSVIQPHTSQENWTPESVPSLFKRTVSDNIIQDWYQPTGTHNAFNAGDLVLFEDRVYQVKAGNYGVAWSPSVTPALWEDLGTLEEYNSPNEDPKEPGGTDGPEEPDTPEEPTEPENPEALGSAANPYTYVAYNGIPHGQEGSKGIYNIGEHVILNDAVYKSLIDANTWAPDAYPAGWELIQ